MPTAKKLKSGNWNCLVYSHTTPDGKRHYESFTAPTKQQAELKATKFAERKKRNNSGGVTLGNAIERYIEAKRAVLSPSTIRSYTNMSKSYFTSIQDIPIDRLTTEDMQTYLSKLSQSRAPKTVKNAYALITASIAFFNPEIKFAVQLPTRTVKPQLEASDEDIKALYEHASDWLRICILLAAFGGLRRGEIASLKYKDISENSVYVHSDMIMDENNKWIYKEIPKNMSSVRIQRIPSKVIELIGTGDPEDFIIKYNPNTISKMFIKLRNRLGINIRFHDLRHYYASIGAILGVPDIYIADFGGWRHDSPVLKNTYQNNIKSVSEKYSDRMVNYFDNII